MSNKTQIATLLPDNTSGAIDPQAVRGAFDIVDPEQQAVPQHVEVAGLNPTVHLKPNSASSASQMQVIYNGHDVASMEWLKATQEFIFNLADKDTGVVKATFEIKQDGHAYIGSKQIATLGDLDRPTIVSAYTATPLKTELITASKLLPHYTNDATFWAAEHDFYIRDDPQTKMLLVKYRGIATNVSEATAGNFFFEKLTKAK